MLRDMLHDIFMLLPRITNASLNRIKVDMSVGRYKRLNHTGQERKQQR